ncbi:MAG TPA: flagellar protein FlaG [Burkholderiaceae bacterium]|nr:flagellar protein FlaG [Burkholderiaceae bacterium]
MIKPVQSLPVALPTDLANKDLPAAMTRANAPMPPSSGAHMAGTATSGQQGNNPDAHPSLDKTLEQLNESMQAWATGMRFDVDEEAQRIVVSIVDSSTGEVLRTVPSEAVLRVAKMIVQLQGSSIDTRA